MAEFVEKALEQLLPMFEQLKLVELFSAEEVDEFIGSCRSFEYKLSKRSKRARDFLAYADYLKEQLALIGARRKEAKFTHRYDDIERPLKNKCAFLYRICTVRFKKLDYYEQEIAFLNAANMLKQCSQAHTRLLQFHGHQPENHVKACHFEFFRNKSADNARTIAMMGLRKFPQHVPLWAAHFEVELHYVAQLLRRRNYLLTETGEEPLNFRKKRALERANPTGIEGDDDELLQLKVARIVYELAMKAVERLAEKRKLLRLFLRTAEVCGQFAQELAENLREHLDHLGDQQEEEEQGAMLDEELFQVDTEGAGAVKMEEDLGKEVTTTMKTKRRKGKSVLDGFDPDDPELKKIMAKAALTEDYDQKPLDEVLTSSQRQLKKSRAAERAKTAGQKWFGLPATELDEERRRDLELVQMRDALDPTQHYKKPDREVLPKYFQIGRIVESKADFYSARLTRKQRKRTLAEELMADHETIARNKKRYGEIVMRNKTAGRGAFQRRGALPRHSRRKNKTKSH